MTFALFTMDGALVAGPSDDEHGLAKIACRHAEKGTMTQLFQLTRPVTFQPIVRNGAAEVECEASS